MNKPSNRRTRPTPEVPPSPRSEAELLLPQQEVFYRIYQNPDADNPRRLLLLHGGGVDGAVTWGGILPHITHWQEILVPDLQAMI